MSIFFESLVRIASYRPQIDQSHAENRRSHIIIFKFAVWRKFRDCRVIHKTQGGSPFRLSFAGFVDKPLLSPCISLFFAFWRLIERTMPPKN